MAGGKFLALARAKALRRGKPRPGNKTFTVPVTPKPVAPMKTTYGETISDVAQYDPEEAKREAATQMEITKTPLAKRVSPYWK